MSDGRESPPIDDYEDEEFADVSIKPADGSNADDLFVDAPDAKEDAILGAVGYGEQIETRSEAVEEFDVSKNDPTSFVDEANIPAKKPRPSKEVDKEEEDGNLFENDADPVQPISLDIPVEVKIPAKPQQFMGKLETKDDFDKLESKSNEVAIEVSNPRKVGEGMNAYLSYKVHTKTSMPSFKRPNLEVERRFSDFLGLHEKLLAKHRHAGRVVPPAPEKSIVGMTRVKMSKTDEEAVSVDFVEKRRAALERYLNRVARHPLLVQDQDFRDFLEQEELPQSTNTRALSGAGVMRLVRNVEDAFSKMTIKMNEEDPWFEEKQQQIESLELQLHKLHAAFEYLVQNKRELASSTAQFAKSAATLGNAEEHTALSRALAQLSDAFEKIETVHQEQANTDYYEVAETLSDYLRIITEISEVFVVRAKSWHNWQSCVQSVKKKKEAEVKAQASGRNDKVSMIQSELRELEAKMEMSKEDFDKLSATIKKNIQRFEKDRVIDFRQLFLVFLKNLLKTQEQYMKNWEAFMPEARAIA